ncbi:hypothetical protein J437_LFUL006459 [Ladona fulva]|uniref:Uncharacterized protein n=1 Tax=Ladona fulva TaxID=123851 RepID=A0A8K0K005_LADFU|nr:hypothetical protein J437_LFUL006459 [Ladona fulva]
MRLLWFACFAILALTVQSAPNKREIIPRLVQKTFSDRKDISELLKKALEKFKILMVKGDPQLGLPVMDPYVMDHREIELNESSLNGQASVDNMSVIGMSTFQIQSVVANDEPLMVNFDLLIPETKVLADHYKFHAMIGEKFDLFGEGFFNMTGINMKLVGEADGQVDADQHLQVTKLTLFITAEQILSALTGLMNDDEECKLANELISEFGPGILEQYGGQLGNFFGEIVRNIINTKIAGLTVDEIIDMINS